MMLRVCIIEFPLKIEIFIIIIFSSAVSFVMSYSFTDSKEVDPLSDTVMVPFVDLLNHHHDHNAELSYHPTHLRLVAIRDIKKVGGAFQLINSYPLNFNHFL